MNKIEFSELDPIGLGLFLDSESYIGELDDNQLEHIKGGENVRDFCDKFCSGPLCICPSKITLPLLTNKP
jgi:hypothetical protein